MKVLHITPYFAPAWAYGGPPRAIYGLTRELVRRGHCVTVLTTDALSATGRTSPLQEIVDGIEVIRLPNLSNTLAARWQLFLPMGAVNYLKRNLHNFDILHLHTVRTIQNALAYRFARESKVPYVLSAHGCLPRISRWMATKALFDLILGRRLLRNAGMLLAVSERERLQYESWDIPSRMIRVVYHGIDFGPSLTTPRRGAFREGLGLDNETKLILYAGRIHKLKGIDFLIRAFAEVRKESDNLVLVVAGPDDGYRAEVADLVTRLGVDRSTMIVDGLDDPRSAYVDADVLAYPSAYEIFGLVPLEAILCGTPVIVTEHIGCADLLREAEAARFVRYGDVAQLTHQLREALEDFEESDRQVKAGRTWITERLSWSGVVSTIENIYESLCPS